MSQPQKQENAMTVPEKDMKDIVALCKRRGFIFPASEIYGGINGFWDFGPLGTELKNNLRDLWWKHMVITPPIGPDGEPLQIVGVDTAIIQNPKSWEASGHVGGFNDPMVDCKESKKRYRADHLEIGVVTNLALQSSVQFAFDVDTSDEERKKKVEKFFKKNGIKPEQDIRISITGSFTDYFKDGKQLEDGQKLELPDGSKFDIKKVVGPDASKPGTLTEPRQFNMMFHSYAGASAGEENKVYLRPETCAGIFLNFKNILDTARVKVPFGIAQTGKAFRNEVTPRNFIFRSREFEQMELEWFFDGRDDAEVKKWFDFWVEQRKAFWQGVGIPLEKLHFLDVPKEELAHYSSRTIDFEYQFPFSGEGFDELEGIAHRGDFDLSAHAGHSGQKLEYQDPQNPQDKYTPHVIEPSCGLTRGVLALICEAYTPDPDRPSGVYLNFHPSVAPKKAAILPLTAKEEHVPLATKLYMDVREHFPVDLDIKQNIGKRYARQDEIGTPFCFTIDNQTIEDRTVTVRHRNTMKQERVHMDNVVEYMRKEMALMA